MATGNRRSRLDASPHLISVRQDLPRARQGALFYLRDEVVRAVLPWNSWGMVDWARGLIREAKPMTSAERAARIPTEG